MPRGDTQDRIYEFIKQTIELKGYPPSVREICDAVHLSSTSTVHGHLARLEKRGLSAVNVFYSLCALSVCGLALAVRLARWA